MPLLFQRGRLETCSTSTVLPFVEAPTQFAWAGAYFTGIRMHTSCTVCSGTNIDLVMKSDTIEAKSEVLGGQSLVKNLII